MLFFLHIPKTGGQTLAIRMAGAFPLGRSHTLRADIRTPEELARLCGEYDFVEGHAAGGTLRGRSEAISLLTVVRDPVEQAISHYRHILREPRLPLHAAANTLSHQAFFDRFAYHMFNFQLRTLVLALHIPEPRDLAGGEERWLLRHLDEAEAAMRWLVPTERLDEFCILWAQEAGHRLARPDAQPNRAEADTVNVSALRQWLRERPERFALDSLLWSSACRRYAAWRHRLLTGDTPGNEPAAGLLAYREGEAGLWLTRDWHPPVHRADGVVEWWGGPGFYPELRLRRAGRKRLTFEIAAFIGLHWDRLRILRPPALAPLPLTYAIDPATGTARYEVELDSLGPDERLVVHAPEGVVLLPAVAPAFTPPRRAFATQKWRLE